MAKITGHGVVCSMPGEYFGYFGWPSAALLDDGFIVVGCSGLRSHHVDPYGKTVIWRGTLEDGFGPCEVIHDSPLDDRDVGLTALGGRSLLATWFTLDSRIFRDSLQRDYPDEFAQMAQAMDAYTDDEAARHTGAWVMRSDDGGDTWGAKVRCPLSTPHGPIVLRDGTLGYLGKLFPVGMDRPFADVEYAVSRDGLSWEVIGHVPVPAGKDVNQFHEPHVIELNDGTLLGMIRYHYTEAEGLNFGLYVTRSRDGGRTWDMPVDTAFHGAPPHLLRHSSGAIVLVYGWRRESPGQRARISRDDGATWSEEIILRADGPDSDLGYPCSVELRDGSIFTVYYQKTSPGKNTGILWTRWTI